MSDVLEKIEYIETHYDVNSIEYDGIKLWSFFRSIIYETYERKRFNFQNSQITSESIKKKISLRIKALCENNFFLMLKKNSCLVFTNYAENRRLNNGHVFRITENLWKIEENIVPIYLSDGNASKLKKYVSHRLINYYSLHRMKRIKLNEIAGSDILVSILEYLKIDFNYQDVLKNLVVKIDFFEKWFRFVKPKSIYVICYYDITKMAAIYVAKKLGIPVIEFQHGLVSGHFAYSAFVDLKDNCFPDYFLSFGEFSKKLVSNYLYSESNKHVIGNYFIEEIQKLKDTNKKLFSEKYPYLDKKIIITVASQDTVDLELIEFSKKLLEKNNDYFVLFKARTLKKYHDELNIKNFIVEKEFNVYQLIQNSSVTITAYSTCALESNILGTPVILFNVKNTAREKYGNIFDEFKTIKMLDTVDNVDVEIQNLLGQDKQLVIDEGKKFYGTDNYSLLKSFVGGVHRNEKI